MTNTTCLRWLHLLGCVVALGASLATMPAAEPSPETSRRQGAELLKTDILGIFAHPDDETGVASTLAYYARGRGAVVAHVYCTRGEGGGNMVGTQAGASLGVLREAELRDCLAELGVRYCYFADELDWAYTESLTATLRKWGKEETLESIVRLIRSLRPEVILTMNPAPNPGQHGHHQAAGVLATEAFDAAADPKRFPLQLSKEGLNTWQARKLYYSGGGSNASARIDLSRPLPNGKLPGQIAAAALSNHRSQAFGNFSNASWLQRPASFTLLKSIVPVAQPESDLLQGLENVSPNARRVRLAGSGPVDADVPLRFVPRPAISNYKRWVQEQGIDHVVAQFPADLPVVAGVGNRVQVEVLSTAGLQGASRMRVTVPDGWKVEPTERSIGEKVHAPLLLDFNVTPPPGRPADGKLIAHLVTGNSTPEWTASATAHPVPRTSVARLKKSPQLDGTGSGWEGIAPLRIAHTDTAQGRATGEADSSAVVRLAHDGRILWLDVEVADDHVVSNIAPNDIKGHWRSDSVEICLDPSGGAEDTMGCYKLGIFPFDSTGVVRAARDADANQGLVEETAPGTRLFSKRTANGYRIQAAIPFREIGPKVKRGQRLGFNVIVYDGDKVDAAPGENINKSRIAWAPRSGVQGRPEDWGRIELE